jgi:hypothetical protein
MNPNIEEEASGYLAIYTNGHGNVAVSQIVFASEQQAREWAIKTFERMGFKATSMARRVVARTEKGEMEYAFLPVVHADADRSGADISDDHAVTIR